MFTALQLISDQQKGFRKLVSTNLDKLMLGPLKYREFFLMPSCNNYIDIRLFGLKRYND